MPWLAWLGISLALGGTGITVIQAAESVPWMMLGLALTVSGIVCLFYSAAGTNWAQRTAPRLGRLRGVHDHRFRVVSQEQLLEAEAELEWNRESLAEAKATLDETDSDATQPMTFEEIKPRIERYMDEGRELYLVLTGDPAPDDVGAVYDKARDWQDRVTKELRPYHHELARDFRQGGSIISPQLEDIHPTDAKTLTTYVERRGIVLRNVLEGTPGKDLEWSSINF